MSVIASRPCLSSPGDALPCLASRIKKLYTYIYYHSYIGCGVSGLQYPSALINPVSCTTLPSYHNYVVYHSLPSNAFSLLAPAPLQLWYASTDPMFPLTILLYFKLKSYIVPFSYVFGTILEPYKPCAYCSLCTFPIGYNIATYLRQITHFFGGTGGYHGRAAKRYLAKK